MGPPPRGRSRPQLGNANGPQLCWLQWGRPREGGVGTEIYAAISAVNELQWGRPREGGVGRTLPSFTSA